VKQETQKTAHWCFVHETQSNCCSALDFLSPESSPSSSKLSALITRFRESYSSLNMSLESKRLKKSSRNWLHSGNALIQWVKNAIFVFVVLPGSSQAQVIWDGIVKRLLIAYFIDSLLFFCQKYRNPFTCVKVIASQRCDVFSRHGVLPNRDNFNPLTWNRHHWERRS